MKRHLSPAALARWSTWRPWLAIGLWLAFMVAAVSALAISGSKQLQNGAVGESARGNAAMNAHLLGFSPHAYGYLHSDSLRTSAAAFRAATDRVAAHMRAATGVPVSIATSPDGHSALVTAALEDSNPVGSLQRAIAAVSTQRISASLVGGGGGSSGDLRRAEELSVPVTLLVLLLTFGSQLPTGITLSSSGRPASSTATAVTDCLCTSSPITIIEIASYPLGGDRRADRPQLRRKPRSLSVPRRRGKPSTGGPCARAVIVLGCARAPDLILVLDPGRVGDEMVNRVVPKG
jgi:hypothetical protein